MQLQSLRAPPVAPDPESCGAWERERGVSDVSSGRDLSLTCCQEEEEQEETTHSLTHIQTYQVVHLISYSVG